MQDPQHARAETVGGLQRNGPPMSKSNPPAQQPETGVSGRSKHHHENSGPDLVGVHPKRIMYDPPYGTEKKGNMIELTCLGKKKIAYKVLSNQPKFYNALPNRGVIEGRKKTCIDLELSDKLTCKALLEDTKTHRFHIQAMEWPEDCAHFSDSKWDRLIVKLKQAGTEQQSIQHVHMVADFDKDAARQQLEEEQPKVIKKARSKSAKPSQPPPEEEPPEYELDMKTLAAGILILLALLFLKGEL